SPRARPRGARPSRASPEDGSSRRGRGCRAGSPSLPRAAPPAPEPDRFPLFRRHHGSGDISDDVEQPAEPPEERLVIALVHRTQLRHRPAVLGDHVALTALRHAVHQLQATSLELRGSHLWHAPSPTGHIVMTPLPPVKPPH